MAESLFEFESFMKGLAWLEGRTVRGRRVGLVSNAGFECVMMADNLKDGTGLDLAAFAPATTERILESLRPLGIDKLLDVHNPLDVTPVADDAAFVESARAFIEDPGVDCAVISNVPLTKALQTLPAGEGHAEDLAAPGELRVADDRDLPGDVDKPVVVNIDAGSALRSPGRSSRAGRDPGLPAGGRSPALPEDVRRPHVPVDGKRPRGSAVPVLEPVRELVADCSSVIAPVWQTWHAVGRPPPWASTMPLMPPPFEPAWQTRQLPRDTALFWYCRNV
ncbi:MAG: hypothetical protein M0C28_38200 [Candidatus Moduliflexus flocculans]|nr:hypothetical protein [Candidatus Moduliflexus flocculans]